MFEISSLFFFYKAIYEKFYNYLLIIKNGLADRRIILINENPYQILPVDLKHVNAISNFDLHTHSTYFLRFCYQTILSDLNCQEGVKSASLVFFDEINFFRKFKKKTSPNSGSFFRINKIPICIIIQSKIDVSNGIKMN